MIELCTPEVYLLGVQQVNDAELERFLAAEGVASWTTDSSVAGEVLAEVAGRVCYMSYAKPRPGGNAEYIRHIKEVGHGSVLEHAVYTLIITGVSRSFSHELVRHRAGFAYSQLSQRYVDASQCRFIVPHALMEEVSAAARQIKLYPHADADPANIALFTNEKEEAGAVWLEAVTVTQEAYKYLSDYLQKRDTPMTMPEVKCDPAERTAARKAARQAARSVLPNATETKIEVTANVRALRHFIEMRCSRHAETEIRNVAYTVWKTLNAVAPNLFGDYTENQLPDGTIELNTQYRKV